MHVATFHPAPTRPADPELSRFVTEDDNPVDNPFSEPQMKLLTRSLEASWTPPSGSHFVALANIGLFDATRRRPRPVLDLLRVPRRPAVVPDVLVSFDVPKLDVGQVRAYFTWVYGKPPDIVVEIVSNRKGGEGGRKLAEYARIGVRYYAIFDPGHHIQAEDVRAFELGGDNRYLPLEQPYFRHAGLCLKLWEGAFAGNAGRWVRWTDRDGNTIPTGEEGREALLGKLRARGIDPNTL